MSKNVIIIGSGPAGISAALYTRRAGFDTTVISKGVGALARAEMENYYGFAEVIEGTKLHQQGIMQAQRLGVKILTAEVVGLDFADKFVVKTATDEYSADVVIVAAGAQRTVPKIPGIKELEGKGVSYCATCDAFFYRNKDVAVLGDGEYALHEALELVNIVNSVTLLTNGTQPKVSLPDNIKLVDKSIAQIEGENVLQNIVFTDGEKLPVKGLFVAIGVAGSGELARKMGARLEGNKVVVDENMQTGIPGLYAAGDCTGGMLQVAKAVYEGAKAGLEAVKYLRK